MRYLLIYTTNIENKFDKKKSSERTLSNIFDFKVSNSRDAAGRVIDFALPMLLLRIILEIPHDYHLVAWFVAEFLVRILGVEIDVPILVIHVLAPIIQELIGAVSLLVAANFRLFTIVINKIIADDSISRIVAGFLSGKPSCAHEQHEKRAQGNDDFLFHTIYYFSPLATPMQRHDVRRKSAQ